MSISRLTGCIASCGLVFVSLSGSARAAESCTTVVGHLVSVEGRIEIQHSTAPAWSSGALNDALCQGDLIRAGERSRATVQLINQAVLRIDQNTAMRLDNVTAQAEERSAFSLLKGAFQSFSRKPRGFEVNTPYLNGSIEGTEFVFRVEDEESVLTVLEGTVIASNDQGKLAVPAGTAAAAKSGQAPQPRILVHPRDAVQWSLYYPPVLAAPPQAAGAAPETQTLLHTAASLLSVGRVDEARDEIDKALAKDPNAGLAYALKAVINVVQNHNDQALVDAKQAVTLSPDSAAAKIALSYAQQAAFDIPAARATLQQAVQQQPQDALAWARLSELQLMLGDRQLARESAQKATSLNPNLSRTQITHGFAALAEFHNDVARTAFERAIELDSADPLPHLGLGLARISAGDVTQGGRDIEVAVALDSNDSLLRSYLGKTYFEEKRTPLDFQQYSIAKDLDPMDPTAYLYSGIARQTVNQPVEAVNDIEKSIELNDNRVVYRGRLLLDKDRAARGTSLARVYQDLGFSQLGVNESTQSISEDPSNASAHRFLSDTYKDIPGRLETSRVSELLQSQLLQDTNLNPIQPSISSTNLNIVTAGGPAEAGYNEFTPLFERNQMQLNATGFGGSNNTYGGEAVLSGVYNSLSGSAGHYYYNTDGYRDNNDLDHKIWDVYGQWAALPALNLQAEYRHRDTQHGDLRQNFDLNDFDPTYQRKSDEDIYRVGARISPDERSKVLLSYIYSDINSKRQNVPLDDVIPSPIPGFPDGFIHTSEQSKSSLNTDQYDAQYLFEGSSFNLVTGASYSNSNADETTTSVTSYEIPPIVPATTDPPLVIDSSSDTDDKRVYTYNDWTIVPSVTGTVGLSYVDFKSDVGAFDKLNVDRVNPKLGIRWAIVDGLTARAAYFKNVMPVLASKRTLEPTQVAGFNQFFDDPNATKSTRYGGGLDWKPSGELAFGTEFTKRDVKTPVLDVGNGTIPFESRNEWNNRGYAYWTPTNRWALSFEAIFDKFKNQNDSLLSTSVPRRVTTWTLPAKAIYFHPTGWFSGVGLTYVNQQVRREQDSLMAEGNSDFTLTDAFVGYRLPKRRGVVSLSVQNIFDKNFEYQDNSYRTFRLEPYVSPYVPDVTVMGRVTLSF